MALETPAQAGTAAMSSVEQTSDGKGGFALDGQDSSASDIPSLPKLSLPKGGGAIRNIGEKFDVNYCTGEGSASIPVQISPGRDGLQPKLTLSYSSGAGNGPFGIGWSCAAFMSVTRKTEKRVFRDTTMLASQQISTLTSSYSLRMRI